LARKYLIDELQYLAMHKLHKFLASLTIYPRGRDAILKLLQYTYDDENVADRETNGPMWAADDLRRMVLEFMMLHRDAFYDFRGHRAVLKQDSEYAMDYAEMTDRMLRCMKKEIAELEGDDDEDEQPKEENGWWDS
jgi:hypothetical protein